MSLQRLKYFYPYILGLLPILIFVALARLVIKNETYKLDLDINFWVSKLRTPFWTEVMKIVSDIGAIGGVFVIGFVCTYLFLHKKINILVGLLICSLGATLFTVFLKILTARNRPELVNRLVVESGFSFPSGHATTAFIAFPVTAIIIYFNPKIPKLFKILCVSILSIFPFIVAFSRLYLGVHYFSDVVAGAMVGLTATCVFYYLMSKSKYD